MMKEMKYVLPKLIPVAFEPAMILRQKLGI